MRCIAHLDIDCFYAQVEANRLGIDCTKEPFVVCQWGTLIAASYPARDAGIQRFKHSLKDAIEICPSLKYCHTATYALKDTTYHYYPNPKKNTHKVALEPYRLASESVFRILLSLEDVEVEKAGVDEAFLDLTDAARKKLSKLTNDSSVSDIDQLFREIVGNNTNLFPDRLAEAEGYLQKLGSSLQAVTDQYLYNSYTLDDCRLLFAAASVLTNIRTEIYEKLHINCSAGVSHNRLLAKCLSARFKPNQQTVLIPQRTLGFLYDMDFCKIRGFGGQVGTEIKRTHSDVLTCADAWLIPHSFFTTFRADEEEIYNRLRGIGDDTVQQRTAPHSITAAKRFSATADADVLYEWADVLLRELVYRYEKCIEIHKVVGRTLTMGATTSKGKSIRVSEKLPDPFLFDSLKLIFKRFISWNLSVKKDQDAYCGCVSLDIIITNFHPRPLLNTHLCQSTLTQFLKKREREQEDDEEPIRVSSQLPSSQLGEQVFTISQDSTESDVILIDVTSPNEEKKIIDLID